MTIHPLLPLTPSTPLVPMVQLRSHQSQMKDAIEAIVKHKKAEVMAPADWGAVVGTAFLMGTTEHIESLMEMDSGMLCSSY